MTSPPIIVDESLDTVLMLPGMSDPEGNLQLHIDSGGRVVRFDHECVLIPEFHAKKLRSPLMVTKSYSLPLWKKRGHQNPTSDSEADSEEAAQIQTQGGYARSPSPPEERLVIKVPIPTFRRRASRSPTRGRSASASPAVPSRLPPCLVHRAEGSLLLPTSTSAPSTSSLHPGMPIRRPSLPIHHRRKDDLSYLETVPLRECCQACEKITEECLELGESWQEKFSRGARRRRSASLDYQEGQSSLAKLSSLHARSPSLGDCVSNSEGCSASKLTLTVDEVDKRRKSQEFERPLYLPCASSLVAPSHDKDTSSSSTATTSSAPPPTDEILSDLGIPDILMGSPGHRPYRSSPIQEEDEAQLFPLPRRSPSGSGTPSPKISPSHSPNASATCLALPSDVGGRISPCRKASGSKESVVSNSSGSSSKPGSSQESLLKASLSRKPPMGVGMGYATNTTNGRLSVPSTPSGSRNSSPTSRLAATVSSATSGSPAEASSTTVAVGSSTVGKGRISPSRSMPSVKGKNKPMPPLPISTSRTRNVDRPLPSPTLPTTPEDATISLSASLPVVSKTSPSPEPLITPPSTRTTFPPSSPSSPSTSRTVQIPSLANTPSSPSQTQTHTGPGTMGKRKLSLTAPFLRAGGALKGVSVDVLKGVSSFGGAAF